MIELKLLTGRKLFIYVPDCHLGIQWITRRHRLPKKLEAGGEYNVETKCILTLKDHDPVVTFALCSTSEPRYSATKGRALSLERAVKALGVEDKAFRGALWSSLLRVLPPEKHHPSKKPLPLPPAAVELKNRR